MTNSHMKSSSSDPAVQYVTFRAGELCFGIDVAKVQEVLKAQPMTPVPLAPFAVKGLVNLRGQIITAIDLRSLLKLEERPEGAQQMNVVVRSQEETISLLVDKIGDVLEIDGSVYEEAPETVAPHIRALLSGVLKLQDELLLVLDSDACLQGERT